MRRGNRKQAVAARDDVGHHRRCGDAARARARLRPASALDVARLGCGLQPTRQRPRYGFRSTKSTRSFACFVSRVCLDVVDEALTPRRARVRSRATSSSDRPARTALREMTHTTAHHAGRCGRRRASRCLPGPALEDARRRALGGLVRISSRRDVSRASALTRCAVLLDCVKALTIVLTHDAR